ncbi:MAG TPA: WhiB family transcriptional regulator [Ilumatobacteraceae bacterium]|nr:WhiB family transcriptional regulator [Ilumatobacteraceae bacterium]
MTLLDINPSTATPTGTSAVITSTDFDEQDIIMNTATVVSRSVLIEPREPDSPRPPGAAEARTPVARCADGHGTMTGLFFSDNVIDIARAKAMCGLCPLQASCLEGALERQEPWGVWGGELLSGGRVIANKRPCGRPPKHPRAVVVIDELGPVEAPVAVA